MIIGICGGSGSGKTTLLKRLYAKFGDVKPSIFSMDNYYYPIEKQQIDDNGQYNFDLPSALDEQKLTDDLLRLKNGDQVIVKEYHFNSPPDKHVLITLDPSELIIVEGLFLFHYEGVRDLLDFSIFVDVDPKIQLDRRLYRDQETRGYSREDILYQWDNHVAPCYKNYLLPYESKADFIFRNDSNSEIDFERLSKELSSRMQVEKTM
ncbi:MAG: AAA family ATPase [Crocinitomicaceae bacterium]